MAEKFRVGFIGCGRPWRTEGSTGFGMAYAHAGGYKKLTDCELVACADISETNAKAFAEANGVPAVYTDYNEMLAKERLDIVSICTWPHLHAQMVIDAARAGVKAIHCEKPMAPTYGESHRMARFCEERGVQLSFNHQRRFLEPFQRARQMLKEGVIGELKRIEGACADIFDWGTHWLDMFFFYNNETPVEWVIGQIDSRKEHKVFGVPLENQAICDFKFANGVRALLFTGAGSDVGFANRLIGSKGIIELLWDQPVLRVMTEAEAGWRIVETKEGLHDGVAIDRAIADLVDALKTGREPELSARRALRATEVIFATYESSRRRGRVDMPLDIDDSPFLSMLEAGDIGPGATRKR
ncbi:MAG: Gfo/Idh/MocA family protein [Armatimonadota bacterium]